jgi:GntR family transcriptional regulator / MocR family aminotransferase
VILEDPCHIGLYNSLVGCGCGIVPLQADDHGIITDQLTGKEHANIVYVTPSHQFPLGGILPASRRSALIRYARENDVYVVEDDYDSEFRYNGAPVAPLYSLDPQRVVYVGTFSKTAFPAMRLGFVILPKTLQSSWREIRTHHDVQNPPFEQAALAELLKSRRFDRYIRAMRNRYGKRRQALMDALKDCFGSGFSTCGDAAGLHAAIRFFGFRFDENFQALCLARGIRAVPLETHCIVKGQHCDELVLGYGHLEPDEIEKGVRLLAAVMRESEHR